jgi:hypothetical protein
MIMHTYPLPVLRAKENLSMQTTRTESRLGRFSYLLKGGAKPRRNHIFIIALALMVLLSFAGVVSADNYWLGTPPVTGPHGTVNGDVDVKFADTWKTDNPATNDNTTATFTGLTTSNVQFARLYVMVYTGNMTENWTGTETITLVPSGGAPVVLANAQPLDLDYAREVGAYFNTSVTAPFITTGTGLGRVTSDYISVFDVKDYITASDMTVYINTTPADGFPRFDGRVKEARLVYGWDVDSGSTGCTEYWINEGHDPVTKNLEDPYTANLTTFGSVSHATNYTATLYVDYSATYLGNGTYTWNGVDISKGTSYAPTITPGYYAGTNKWTWNDLSSGPGLASGNNVLTYYRTNSWYKIPLAVLTVKNTGNIYDFSGNYAGTPVGYKQEIYIRPPNSVSDPVYSVTNSNLAYNDNVYETGSAADMTYYAAQRFNFTISEDRSNVVSLTATWIGKGYRTSSGNGAYLYVYNWTSGSYEQLATTPSGSKVTLTGSKTSGLTNYISTDNKVILVAEGKYASTMSDTAHLDTDYVKLVVVDP